MGVSLHFGQEVSERALGKAMRLLIDSLVALTLTGVLAGVVFQYRTERELETRIDLAQREVARLTSQIMLQAALEEVPLTQRGYPAIVDPEWFNGTVPRNPLVGPGYPWVEIAGAEQRDLQDPPNRSADHTGIAQFWYNPYTGQVRARVPGDAYGDTALRIYNEVNGTELTSWYLE